MGQNFEVHAVSIFSLEVRMFYYEDGGIMYLRNFGVMAKNYTLQQLKNLINTANIVDEFLQLFLGNMPKLFCHASIFMIFCSKFVMPGKLQNIAGVDGTATSSN
jgi:allantoicase